MNTSDETNLSVQKYSFKDGRKTPSAVVNSQENNFMSLSYQLNP